MPTWPEALAALLLSVSAPAVGVPAGGHDRAFWRRIVESRYQVPAGESSDALVVELLRAFDPRRGWMHATAHTADVLKFLGRSPRLRPADQKRILDGVAAQLRDAGQVFTHGENERLAAAVMSLALRPDLDAAAFGAFLAALAEPGAHLWDKGPLVDPARYAAAQNAKDLLRSLYVKLALRPPPGPEAVRREVLGTLEKLGP